MTNPVATLYGYELHHDGHYYAARPPEDRDSATITVTPDGTVGVKTTALSNRDPHHVAAYARTLTTACKVANYFQAVIDDQQENNNA